jgi:hypothetical protein
MDSKGTVILALVGLTNHDLTLFKSIAKLSGHRTPSYRVAEASERATADIYIINGDDHFARKEGENLMGDRSVRRIDVCKELKPSNSFPTLVQPLNAKKVIEMLDRLAAS